VLSSSTARTLELAGYGLIVVTTVSGVLQWERMEKLADRLHVAAGLVGYAMVVVAIQSEKDRHLFDFPCHLGAVAPYRVSCAPAGSGYVPKAVPSWASTSLHSLPWELLLTGLTALLTMGARGVWRRVRAA
jgi:hypothetical protein